MLKKKENQSVDGSILHRRGNKIIKGSRGREGLGGSRFVLTERKRRLWTPSKLIRIEFDRGRPPRNLSCAFHTNVSIELGVACKVCICRMENQEGSPDRFHQWGCWDVETCIYSYLVHPASNWCRFQRCANTTVSERTANPKWPWFTQLFQLFRLGLCLSPELSQYIKTGQQIMPISFLLA